MDFNDIKASLQSLYEILLQKDQSIIEQIKSIVLSAVSENSRINLAKITMTGIHEKLIEWGINIPSFSHAISENYLESFQYLMELVQNEDKINFDKINDLYNCIKKNPKKIERYFDCFEHIPEALQELENSIEYYKMNPDSRMKMSKSLKEASTLIYLTLNKLAIGLRSFPENKTSELNKSIEESIKKLIKLSFVVSEYPPKIIKKKTDHQAGTHFNAAISCLIEHEKLFSSIPVIHVNFLNEDNLRNFIHSNELNANSKINYKEVKKINSINSWLIKKMIWNPTGSESNESRTADRKTNIKAVILFRIKIMVNPYGLARLFEVTSDLFSDIIISVVHTNQEIDAHLTLFWDDYFRIDKKSFLNTGRFLCPHAVGIPDLTVAISNYFLKHTSRGLTQSNILYLEKKLYTKTLNGLITFHDFSRTLMVDSKHSFGQWIILIIKLLKVEGTITLWINDLIEGFITKDAADYLMTAQNGSFILRFSEKNPKIGVVTKDGNKYDAWNPFSIEECRRQSLPERLMSYEELIFIRNTSGQYVNKVKCLSDFIDNKKPDDGYTQRGRLSRLFEGNLYMDDHSPMLSEEFNYNLMDEGDLDLFPEIKC